MKTYVGMALVLAALPLSSLHADDVVRYPLLGGSKFPIARAVEIPAGTTLIFHSGMTPTPKDANAAKGTPEYWGDTTTQALSAFANLKASLDEMGLGFGDVVKMLVFLVADPADKDGHMDFQGFMSTSAPPSSPICRRARRCRWQVLRPLACWWRSK
jgi:enamine deaminase RidA (YjgF/YER057c/UK114 family)